MCLCIMFFKIPLNESDFIEYMKIRDHTGETIPRTQNEAVGYALAHSPKHLRDLSSSQLLYLPTQYIPNITDFVEDNIN